jgi:hypothetical protein
MYSRDKSVVNYKKYAKRKNEQDNTYYYDYDTKHKDTMSLVGASFSKRSGMVDWNASTYMMREHIVSELWASLNLTGYFGEYPDHGRLRRNVPRQLWGELSLPWQIGSVWYSHEQLSSGKFLDIYENKGNTWGASFSLPSFGLPSAGNLSLMRQEDDLYRYKRYQLDYSQGYTPVATVRRACGWGCRATNTTVLRRERSLRDARFRHTARQYRVGWRFP